MIGWMTGFCLLFSIVRYNRWVFKHNLELLCRIYVESKTIRYKIYWCLSDKIFTLCESYNIHKTDYSIVYIIRLERKT